MYVLPKQVLSLINCFATGRTASASELHLVSDCEYNDTPNLSFKILHHGVLELISTKNCCKRPKKVTTFGHILAAFTPITFKEFTAQ